MFGTNPTEKFLREHDGKMLDVQEVFPTLQGEGPFAGRPATFIRLAGCHLKCWWCDTDFLSKRKQVPVHDLVTQAFILEHNLVVLTGGEPMRQNIVTLCEGLYVLGHHVQIETAGSFWPTPGANAEMFERQLANNAVSIVVSPKLASVHDKVAEHACAYKYIIGWDDELEPDGLPATSTQLAGERVVLARPPPGFPREKIYVQPRDSQNPELNVGARKACVRLCLEHGYTLSLQQHKILELP
jgi:organic radical activating enzyme